MYLGSCSNSDYESCWLSPEAHQSGTREANHIQYSDNHSLPRRRESLQLTCLYSRLGQYRMLSRCISVLGGSQWVTQFSCSHFGWKLSWKLVLRFSPMWEPTRRTRTGKNHLWKERTGWVFTWKPKSGSQGFKQIWFIGFCCSSSYMGLLLLALLVFLLIWGCYSSLLLG